MQFISRTVTAPSGDAEPGQLSAVFQPYGAISTAGLPASVLTVANTLGVGQILAQTYFKQLGTLPSGQWVFAFQCDIVPPGFLGSGAILFYYGATLIAVLDTSPDFVPPAIEVDQEVISVTQD